jgi:hypothetical protein
MSESKCWYELNIGVEDALRSDFTFTPANPIAHEIPMYHQFKPTCNEDIYNPEWIKYMESIGVPINIKATSLVFSRNKHEYDLLAHIDTREDELFDSPVDDYSRYTVSAINIVIGGDESKMIWYDIPENYAHHRKVINPNAEHKPAIVWPVQHLKKIDSHTLSQTKLTLVRTNLPHSITNGKTDRYCVSTKFHKSMRHLDWDGIVDHFRKHNLIAS